MSSAARCRASATNGSSATPPTTRAAASTGCSSSAPCLGIGSWRRNPDGKWRASPNDLAELVERQRAILDSAARL